MSEFNRIAGARAILPLLLFISGCSSNGASGDPIAQPDSGASAEPMSQATSDDIQGQGEAGSKAIPSGGSPQTSAGGSSGALATEGTTDPQGGASSVVPGLGGAGLGGSAGATVAENGGTSGFGASPGASGSGGNGTGVAGGAAGSGEAGMGPGGAAGAPGDIVPDLRMICSRAEWSAPSLAVLSGVSGAQLNLITADGTLSTFELGLAGKPEEVAEYLEVRATSSHVAAIVIWRDGSTILNAQLTLFDRLTQATLFSLPIPNYGDVNGIPLLGEDGSNALNVYDADTGYGVMLVDSSGESLLLAGYQALAPVVDSELPVTLEGAAFGELSGWLNVETGTFRPYVAEPPLPWSEAVQFATETSNGIEIVPLESTQQATDASISVVANGDWLLLGPDASEILWVVDRRDGSVRSIDVTLPDGVAAFACYEPDAVLVDPRGRVLRSVRDDAVASWLRREEDGSWLQIGLPMTEVQALEAVALGDTYLIKGAGPGTRFCAESTWQPAPAEALSGLDSMQRVVIQFVRPADGLLHVRTEMAESQLNGALNSNATCFHEWNSATQRVAVQDLFREESVELAEGFGGRIEWLGPG